MSTDWPTTTKSFPKDQSSVPEKPQSQHLHSILTQQQTKMDMAKDSDSIQLDQELEKSEPLSDSGVAVKTAELFSLRHTEADESSASGSHTVVSVSASSGCDIDVNESTTLGSSTDGDMTPSESKSSCASSSTSVSELALLLYGTMEDTRHVKHHEDLECQDRLRREDLALLNMQHSEQVELLKKKQQAKEEGKRADIKFRKSTMLINVEDKVRKRAGTSSLDISAIPKVASQETLFSIFQWVEHVFVTKKCS